MAPLQPQSPAAAPEAQLSAAFDPSPNLARNLAPNLAPNLAASLRAASASAASPETAPPVPMPQPVFHDVTIVSTKKLAQVRVLGVPPEEFGIERAARDIKTCNYCFHDVVTRPRR